MPTKKNNKKKKKPSPSITNNTKATSSSSTSTTTTTNSDNNKESSKSTKTDLNVVEAHDDDSDSSMPSLESASSSSDEDNYEKILPRRYQQQETKVAEKSDKKEKTLSNMKSSSPSKQKYQSDSESESEPNPDPDPQDLPELVSDHSSDDEAILRENDDRKVPDTSHYLQSADERDNLVNNSKKKKEKQKRKAKQKRKNAEAKARAEEDEQRRIAIEEKKHEEERRHILLQMSSAVRIQSFSRRFICRMRYGNEVAQRVSAFRSFKSSWGIILKILKRKSDEPDAPHLFSWFAEKNRYEMVLYASDIPVGEEDIVISDQQKLFQNVAADEIRKESGTRKMHENDDKSNLDCAGDFINNQSRELSLDELGIVNEETSCSVENPFVRETIPNEEKVPSVMNVEFTETVMKWLQNADSRYREMFSDRIERLAQGERSYMLAKRLKGCSSPVFEAKLDAGQRILWTQLRRIRENPSIIIWFVSKHDKVPHFIQIMNKYFDRLHNTLNTEGIMRSTGVYREGDCFKATDDNMALELTEDLCLLDPLRNSPLKIYVAAAADMKLVKAKKINVSKFPLRLNKMEKDVNDRAGSVLLLGRSGTGKTVCLCNRMSKDRLSARTVGGDPISQLFVCRSRRLRDVVKRFYDSHCRVVTSDDEIDLDEEEEDRRLEEEKHINQANFYTLDVFIENMNETITRECGASHRNYERRNYMDYNNFKENIYPRLKYNSKNTGMDPLVLWTQIRTHIKGSFEALRDTAVIVEGSSVVPRIECRGMLSKEAYLNFEVFPPGRCRLDESQRREAYDLFTKYQDTLLQHNMWDDTDRVMDLLLRFDMNRDCEMNYTGKGGPYNKVYVDEIQDSTQAEITLLFLSCGFDFDALFLAGDNAQSVVEGVDFRFEEVRSIMYALSKDVLVRKREVNKPVTLVTNFRSHSGILNCATGILDMMFALFPHAAKVLERDKGFCKGPRPVFFFDTNFSESTLRNLLSKNPRVVVLFRDEYDVDDNDSAAMVEFNRMLSAIIPEGTLKLGIKEAKGMEFDDVVIVDFFSGLPERTQEWWKKRFQNTSVNPAVETQMPQMESLFKLLYTGVTRCCNRLIFVETQHRPASQAFFRWLKNKDLAEPYVIPANTAMVDAAFELTEKGDDNYLLSNSDVVYVSNDEWRVRGIELLMAADQDNSRSNLKFLLNARLCFERAGDLAKSLKEKTNVMIESEKMKSQFKKYFADTQGGNLLLKSKAATADKGGSLPAIPEASAVMLRCIKEGLLQETVDIAEFVVSCLPSEHHTRHFQENILSPLKQLVA